MLFASGTGTGGEYRAVGKLLLRVVHVLCRVKTIRERETWPYLCPEVS